MVHLLFIIFIIYSSLIRFYDILFNFVLGLQCCETTIEDNNSLLGCELTNSRRSLADTSITSTADLSVFSNVTPSNVYGSTLDVHSSNASVNSSGEKSSISNGFESALMKPNYLGPLPEICPKLNSDVLRIYVPYSPIDTPTASVQNDDIKNSVSYGFPENKIRIEIDNEELLTPLVDCGQK